MPSVEDLVAKYFPASLGTSTEDSSVDVFIDARMCFQAVYEAIQNTGEGDIIYILAWRFDPTMELVASSEPIGKLLAEKAKNEKVDVRLILWSNWLASRYIPNVALWNMWTAAELRGMGLDSVLVDWSGELTGSHHAKSVVVSSGGNTTAFVTGFDFGRNSLDHPGHPVIDVDPATRSFIGCVPGGAWHDAGVRVRGHAAIDVWHYFVSRWNTCVALGDNRRFILNSPGLPGGVTTPTLTGTAFRYIPSSAKPLDISTPPKSSGSDPGVSVRVARSLSESKVDDLRRAKPTVSGLPAAGNAIEEIRDVLVKAITAAKRFIYVEDQGLNCAFRLNERLADKTHAILFPLIRQALEDDVYVIFVTSSVGDPVDGVDGPINGVPYNEMRNEIIDPLEAKFAAGTSNGIKKFAFYRINCLTVHSKLVIVDDEFFSIGSANFWDRSLTGEDSELNVVAVSGEQAGGQTGGSTLVRDTRVRLWAEHLGIPLPETPLQVPTPEQQQIRHQLTDEKQALGMWLDEWRTDKNFRFVPETPSPLAKPPGPRLSLIYPKLYARKVAP